MNRQIKRIITSCSTCGRTHTQEIKENAPDGFIPTPKMICRYDGKDVKYDFMWNDEV